MSRDLLGSLHAWREQYGDLIHLRIWPEHQIVVADPELARELLVTHHEALIRWERGVEVFSQVHGHSVLTSEGDAWKRKRTALQPSFLPRPVQTLVPAISAAAARAMVGWKDGMWPVESALNSLGMDVILHTMFSSAIDTDARAAEHAVRVISAAGNSEMYWPVSMPDWMPWNGAKRRAKTMLKALIEHHVQARLTLDRVSWPADTLSTLLALHLDHPEHWTLQAVRDECMTTFLAGHETTAATLTWWSWCMASNPQVQAAVRREVDEALGGNQVTADNLSALPLVKQSIQETLRMYPAAPVLMTRRCLQPITLGGWEFPARTLFTIPVHLMHYDARWYPEPKAFRPERFAPAAPPITRGAFMPFGSGPRVCLGQHLALAEMTVIAAILLQRFDIAAPSGMRAPEPTFNITLRPSEALHLSLRARVADVAVSKAGAPTA